MDALYIINEIYLVTLKQLIGGSALIIVLLMILYMLMSNICSFWFKNFSNALIATGAILSSIYFIYRIVGNHVALAWIPFFYINPTDIVSSNYPISYLFTVLALLIWIVLFFMLNLFYIRRLDLKGSDA